MFTHAIWRRATNYQKKLGKKRRAFEIPSAFRTWSSSGLSSYSGTSLGLATVIGVFLIFWSNQKYVNIIFLETKTASNKYKTFSLKIVQELWLHEPSKCCKPPHSHSTSRQRLPVQTKRASMKSSNKNFRLFVSQCTWNQIDDYFQAQSIDWSLSIETLNLPNLETSKNSKNHKMEKNKLGKTISSR